MPPAIEEYEEEEYESYSEHAASSPQLASDGAMVEFGDESKQPSQQFEHGQSPELVVSDIPLVVSDIPDGVAAPMPQHQPPELMGKGPRMNGKRKASPQKVNQLPKAKRRRGPRRDFPCVYCVRRLANNPSWACTEAIVNQFGEPHYTGTRCSECVAAHVSCISVPSQGLQPVTILMKAAQEVRKDGTKIPALLAAYEAAIGPALRAIVGVGLPPSEKTKRRSKKPNADRKSAQGGAADANSSSRQATRASINKPRPRHEDEHLAPGHTGRLQRQPKNAGPDPTSFPALPQASQQHPPPQPAHDPVAFRREERQALRRRKVEALESLAHTAALFLAEFMDFRKGLQAGGEPRVDPGAGSAYAAAAAGMAAELFRPSSEAERESGWDGRDGAGGEQSGRPTDSEVSATDSEDDEDIPAKTTLGNADDGEYDSEEALSEGSGGFKEGFDSGHDELDVKVEED